MSIILPTVTPLGTPSFRQKNNNSSSSSSSSNDYSSKKSSRKGWDEEWMGSVPSPMVFCINAAMGVICVLMMFAVFAVFYWGLPNNVHTAPDWRMGNLLYQEEQTAGLSALLQPGSTVPANLRSVTAAALVDLTPLEHSFQVVNDPTNPNLDVFYFYSDPKRGNIICRNDPWLVSQAYISVLTPSGLEEQITPAYSLAIWLNPTNFSATQPANLISSLNVSQSGYFSLLIEPGGGEVENVHNIGTGVNTFLNQVGSSVYNVTTPGTWFHYLFTWSNFPAYRGSVYINGTLYNQTTFPSTTSYWKGSTTGIEILGSGYNGCADLPTGWTYELTASQAWNVYHSQLNVINDILS